MAVFDFIQSAIATAAQQQAGQQPAQADAAAAITAGMTGGGAALLSNVDIEQVLQGIEQQKGQPSNWRTSIVDLMKLLDLDSSLHNRAELATELGYTGEKNGSAEMNIWLHRQVMDQLERNGGRVPDSLKQ